jgi:23S rRNA (guanosine2251-2'-O)-methyltransferase
MPEITLIAHNIRSTHNIGSIFRTAEGFGVKKIIISGYSPYPTYPGDMRLPHEAAKLTRQIHKTALGAEMVPFEYHADLETWLDSSSLPLLALEQSPDSVNLGHYDPPKEFALLLGEEVSGIEPQYLQRCDYILEIPMRGHKESFNVSVATGIALYALTSK